MPNVNDAPARGDPVCETPGCAKRCGYRRCGSSAFSKHYYKHCHACRGSGGGSHGSRRLREIRVGTVCVRCGFVASHPSQIQIDHIVPVGYGGDKDDPENMQLICANCHAYKSAVEDKAMVKQLRRIGIQLEMDFAADIQEALW